MAEYIFFGIIFTICVYHFYSMGKKFNKKGDMSKMINDFIANQIREEKKNGALNSALMKKYNLTYRELRIILDGEETDEEEN
jgi:hypothetical protein